MKNISFLILFAFLFVACVDDKNASRPGEPVQEDQDTVPGDFTRDAIDVDRDNTKVEDETFRALKEPADHEMAGLYRKIDPESEECDLLKVSFTEPTRLCIIPGELYISAKFLKSDINEAYVFLIEEIEPDEIDYNLPWDEFDRNIPIATLHLRPDGNLEVRWRGFMINGEASEYALPTDQIIEGVYQKE